MVITYSYLLVFIIGVILTGVALWLDTSRVTHKYAPEKLHRCRNIVVTLLVIAIIYLCISNFPISLTLLVLFCGAIALVDQLFFKSKRTKDLSKPGVIVENARSFFPVLLLVWVIRSFIIQPYRVPTGSLEPTVMAGDFIIVNQFDYGLRFPIGNLKFLKIGEPKTGDIALFYAPPNPSIVFVKRVIGVPGDHIVYKNKVLYINGQEAKQAPAGTSQDVEPGSDPTLVERYTENLAGIKHDIFVVPVGGEDQDFDLIVPAGEYFMMGDNRDHSDDSRYWGFVPERNLIGKAFGVWMSWDPNNHRVRWHRIGKAL